MGNIQWKIKSVYELTDEERKELDIEEGKEFDLFDSDPDYMDEPVYTWDSKEKDHKLDGFNRIFFFRWIKKGLCITSDEPTYLKELYDFIDFNNPNSKREEIENTREAYEKEEGLKIAYRGGVGCGYSLYKYTGEY